jgi:hypothetical protein
MLRKTDILLRSGSNMLRKTDILLRNGSNMLRKTDILLRSGSNSLRDIDGFCKLIENVEKRMSREEKYIRKIKGILRRVIWKFYHL